VATVANLFIRIAASSTEFEKSLKGAEAQFNKTGAKLQSVGANLTKAISLPLVAGATAAIKFSSDFETAMTKTVTLAGETSASMQKMRVAVLDMSKDVGIGPTQLAEALVAIESTGFTGAAALEVLKASAMGSAIGMGEAADVGRAITAVVNAYGEANITAAQAADQLHQTVLVGGADADTLAGELGRVVGVASSLGVSFAEVGAFIATYTKLGLSAAEATTGLSGVLNTILSPSREARNALADIGMSAEGLRQQVAEKGLGSALTGLIGKLQGNADATGALFGNVRALAGVMGTAGTQAESYRANLEKIQNSTGSLSTAFKVWEGTTAATWGKFTAGAQAAAIAIGDQLAPAFSRVLQAAMPLLDAVVAMVNWFSQLPQPVQTAAIGFGALLAALGPVVYIVGSFMKAGAGLLGLLRMIPGAAGVAGSGWALLSNPITLTAAAIGAVLYALKQLTGSWTTAFKILMPPVGFLLEAWEGVADGIRRARALLPGGGGTPDAPGAPRASLNAALKPAMEINQAMSLLDSQLDSTTKKYDGLGKAGATAMKGIGKATKEALEYTRAIDRELAIYTGANMGAGGALGGLMGALQQLQTTDGTASTGNFLGGSLGQYNSLQDLANQFGMSQGATPNVETLNVTQQATEYAAEQMAQTAKETVDGIRGAFQYFTGSLSGGMAALLGGLMNVLEKQANTQGSLIQKFMGSKLGKKFGGMLDIGMGAFGGGFAFGEEMGKGGGALAGAGSGALTGLLAGGPIGAVVGGLAGLFGGLFGGGKKKREEQAKMAEARGQLLDQFGGMEGLTKAAGLAGVSVATLFATDNAKTFQAELEKVTTAIEVMQKRVATTVGEIDKVMAEGGLIGKDLWASILQDKDAEEIKAKLAEVFDASVQRSAEGFTKIASNFELLKRPINEIGVLADAAFAGLLAGGASIPEAIAQMGDGLAHIQELLAKSGEGATGPLATLLNYQAITAANQGLFELLSGVDDMLTGLGNSGLLTQERFAALGLTITQAFGQLQAQGVAAGTALELMQPQLQKLWEAQQMFGLQTDAATQALIDQAVQQGIVGQNMKDVNSQILDVLKAIASVLGAEIPGALAALPGQVETAATAFAGISIPDIRVGIKPNWKDWHWPEQPTGPTGGTGSRSPTSSDYRPMATGGIVTRPTRALIGEAGPEAVIPLDEWREQTPAIRIDRVYGTVDKAFVESIAKTVLLGGKPATAWRGVR
jgi:TP901 family phage tail tape measure protein